MNEVIIDICILFGNLLENGKKEIILMNKLFINIIDSYMGIDDELRIYEQGRKLRFSKTYVTEMDIETLEEKLMYTILTDKGDGLELEINSIGNFHYIDIILLFWDKNDEEYNIDYLIKFLEQFKVDFDDSNFDELTNYDTFIYIQYEPEEFDNITKIFKQYEIDIKLITQTRNRFENGAGDYWIGYLLGIASSATIEVVKFATNKLKEKHKNNFRSIHLGNLDIENLQRNLSHFLGINALDLKLISFQETIEGKYKVTFRTRYEKIKVISDKDGNISKYELHEISQTNI
jgi:hypothetical protein